MRGFDVTQGEVNRDMRLNGAICACWDKCADFPFYRGFSFVVICPRRQQFRSDTRGVGRVCGSGVMVGRRDVFCGANSVCVSNMYTV